jgi:hypothetical protein
MLSREADDGYAGSDQVGIVLMPELDAILALP